MCSINGRIALTIVSIIVAINAIGVFAIQLNNWSATSIAVVSLLCGFVTLFVLWNVKTGNILNWSRLTLQLLLWPNLILGLLGIISFFVCMIVSLVRESSFYQDSLWFTGVWSLMVTRFTWQTAYVARSTLKQIENSSDVPIEYRSGPVV